MNIIKITQLSDFSNILKEPIPVIHKIDFQSYIGHILEITPSYIVIGGNKELILLDKNTFAVIKVIPIEFCFYNYYKHFLNDHMIFHYWENNFQFLMLLNLNTEEQKRIPLDESIPNRSLLPLCAWSYTTCLIYTSDENCVSIGLDDATLYTNDDPCPHCITPFKAFFSLQQEYRANKIDLANNYMVFENAKTGTYHVMRTSNAALVKTPIAVKIAQGSIPYHDFDYNNGILVATAQDEMQIANAKQVIAILKPDTLFLFVSVRFLDEEMTRLVVVANSLSSPYSTVSVLRMDCSPIDNES